MCWHETKNNIFFLITFFFFISVTCQAESIIDDIGGIFSIFDLEVIEDGWDYVTGNSMKPDKVTQTSGHVTGWVDIVGFKNMSEVYDEQYLPTDPASNAIVLYDFSPIIPMHANIVEWKTEQSVYMEGNVTVAQVDVWLTYEVRIKEKETTADGKTRTRIRYVKKPPEHQVFYDYEIPPQIYHTELTNKTIDVYVFNNTFSPKVVFNIPNYKFLTKSTVTYKDESITHYTLSAIRDTTNKSVTFANFTNSNRWVQSDENDNITRTYNTPIILIPEFDEENITVTLSDMYGTYPVTNFNVTEIDWEPSKSFNPLIWFVLGFVIIIGYGSYKIIKTVNF